MRVTNISVELEKRVSDGDYGSERAQVRLDVVLDAHDEPSACLEALLYLGRHQAEADLKRSVNLNVRRALKPPPRLCSDCEQPLEDEDRTYLHRACDERRRAERAEQLARAREEHEALLNGTEGGELVPIGARDGDADGDEDLPL
jgi:hypothetical protein